MAGKVLSMEIGQANTRVVEIDYMAKAPRIYNAFTVETPKDMVQDGVISRNEDFIINLKAELRRREIKTDNVVFTVSSSRIANREARIPLCKENKILPLITANASDYFPVDMNQYHLVYNILGKVEDKDEKQYRLSLLAVPNDVTTSYIDLAHSLNMHIRAMDYMGNSIFQVARQSFTTGTNAVIKIDEHNSLITIMKDGEIVLQRAITHGVNAAIENMMELDLYGSDMTYQDATRAFVDHRCLRRYLNVDVDYQEEEDTSDEMMMSRIMITENLRYLIGNIGRILEYYVSRNENDNIENVVLVGIGADFLGLDDLLSNELGYTVKPYEGLDTVRIVNSAFVSDMSVRQLAACVGASIKPLQLLSAELLKGEKQQSLVIPFAVMVAGVAIGLSLFLIGQIMVSAEEANKKELQDEISRNVYIQSIKTNYDETNKTFDTVSKYDNLVKNNNEQLTEFIEELEKKMPSSFVTMSFSATTAGIQINVTCESKEGAATALQNLRSFKTITVIASSGFQETKVDMNAVTPVDGEEVVVDENHVYDWKTTVSFSLTCTYKNIATAVEEAAK